MSQPNTSTQRVQPVTPADCRHSKAGFHAVFVDVARRRHLSSDAKLLYGALVSMVRQRLEWTQAEIAEQLGWGSRQKVWRAAAELVADNLLVVRRRGLGLPNEYLLVPTAEIAAEDIAAKAKLTPSDRAGHPEGRQAGPSRARTFYPKKKREERVDIRAPRDYYATSEGVLPRRT